MLNGTTYQGKNKIITTGDEVRGRFVEMDAEVFYQIWNYHEMADFFINIVSDSDHWMFISSNGSLTAGRKDRDNALFPYYTVDKIHDYRGITGSRTYIRVKKGQRTFLWQPFCGNAKTDYRIQRNIYKSIYGNKIVFEEINNDLELVFRYGWYNSEKFGFVKKSSLLNTGDASVETEICDGIRNILPYGIDYGFQNEYSNLLDAYKKSELIEDTTLALFMLSAIPVDRAEPSEALKTTTVWSSGFGGKSRIFISGRQINKFMQGMPLEPEKDIRATRGAYFINGTITLKHQKSKAWFTVAEINQDSTDVANLVHFLKTTEKRCDLLQTDIELGTNNLKKMVASADGFQKTYTDICCARHYSNTLYNIMRGGIFKNAYEIEIRDFRKYASQINRFVYKENQNWVLSLAEKLSYTELIALAERNGDKDLIRITYEYLPLTFSRRHGDPSRPWNKFSIETRNEDGSVKYNYEGNWRDIFQNWEALCYSYPGYIEGVISKFVNASTIDGYNPYRILREGIDWETPDPKDPWAYIGYWGDHQIIYLQKLLELSHRFHPGKLDKLMTKNYFTYANVPYRIKPFDQLIRDPKNTVEFDSGLNNVINSEVAYLGADAKLLKEKGSDQIYKVNLTEKILVTLLSKLSNFIPEAGIWMNTQRPEWNDANNALVGNGTSMVTLYYLRRFVNFWKDRFVEFSQSTVELSEEVAELFNTTFQYLNEQISLLDKGFSDADRWNFINRSGQAHSRYRLSVYNYGFSGDKETIGKDQLVEFSKLVLQYIDQSIRANKRSDGLYHAYNLITIGNKQVSIRHLYEMLEGQVAVLSSGLLSPKESLDVLNALKSSRMFRPDQYSYMLYPDRQLPRFMDKNRIPPETVNRSVLLQKLIEEGDTSIIKKDDKDFYHFNGALRNAAILDQALDRLRIGKFSRMVEEEKDKIMAIYETLFDHQSFTGRSGTFYGYEGLGCIYWHMVSKLLLAVQDCYFNAVEQNSDALTTGKLKEHYYEIKAGIGLYKSPEVYGAFPMDAYSHTPANAGVKQPGLTGQVKEDVLSRFAELGIQIRNGEVFFNTSLINPEEILKEPVAFEYFSIDGKWKKIRLKKGQMAFTFCQAPVVYSHAENEKVEVVFSDGKKKFFSGNTPGKEISRKLFARNGNIAKVNVSIKLMNG